MPQRPESERPDALGSDPLQPRSPNEPAARARARGGAAREVLRRLLGSLLCVGDLRDRLERMEAAVDDFHGRVRQVEAGGRRGRLASRRWLDDDAALMLPGPLALPPLLTGSDHLHSGFRERRADSLAEAQDHLARQALSFLPEDGTNVLFAAPGPGAIAFELLARGLDVTLAGPSAGLLERSQAEAQRSELDGKLDGSRTGLADDELRGRFDACLCMEFLREQPDLERTLAGAAASLQPGGRLVVADLFLDGPRPRDADRFHELSHVLDAAASQGLGLHARLEISRAVAPMIERFLDDLHGLRGQLLEKFADRRPDFEQDLDTALEQAHGELQGLFSGALQYQIISWDAPDLAGP